MYKNKLSPCLIIYLYKDIHVSKEEKYKYIIIIILYIYIYREREREKFRLLTISYKEGHGAVTLKEDCQI